MQLSPDICSETPSTAFLAQSLYTETGGSLGYIVDLVIYRSLNVTQQGTRPSPENGRCAGIEDLIISSCSIPLQSLRMAGRPTGTEGKFHEECMYGAFSLPRHLASAPPFAVSHLSSSTLIL